jgi:hypothetical protein
VPASPNPPECNAKTKPPNQMGIATYTKINLLKIKKQHRLKKEPSPYNAKAPPNPEPAARIKP